MLCFIYHHAVSIAHKPGFVFEMLANSILGEKLLQRIVDKIECLNPVNDEGMETKVTQFIYIIG